MNATRKLAALAAAIGALATASAQAQSTEPLPPLPPLTPPGAAPGVQAALPPVPMPVVEASLPGSAASGPKAAVSALLRDARLAMQAGDRSRAEQLVARASAMNVPETLFRQGEDTPSQLAMELRRRIDPAVLNAAAAITPGADSGVRPAIHYPSTDGGQARPVAALTPVDGPRLAQLPPQFESVSPEPTASAPVLLAEGEQSLREGDLDTALMKFQAAHASRNELDPNAGKRLDNHLRMLASADQVPPPATQVDSSMIAEADQDQQVLARQLVTAVGRAQVESRQLRESEPRKALELLERTKSQVENSGVASAYRDQLLRRLDITIGDTRRFIEDNRAQIELDERNASIEADIAREQIANQKKREKIAELIEQFNDKLDQDSFLEADVLAKRLYELAPDDPVVKQVMVFSKLARRNAINDENNARKEALNWNLLENIDRTAGQPGGTDGSEIYYDRKSWDNLQNRERLSAGRGRLNDREKEIERRLDVPVQVDYEDRPLKEVMQGLERMAGVDIYLDPRGLSDEGVTSDTPVSLQTRGEISLRSALNLILSQVNLGYTIRDEVLQVTSQELRDGDVYKEVYYVADLVIPIPNFVPSNNIGLQGLINDALAVTNSRGGGLGAPGALSFVNGTPTPGTPGNPDVLAQVPSGQIGGSPQQLTTGPGGLGGAASADFDSLIELITSTVASDTWAENGGGEADIRPFPTNLSLVVSQTQSVHEEIASLLEQLRKLQDLQVTIEVRFIRLNDDFFERIGIDFDLNINDNILGTDQILQTSAGGALRPNETVSGGAGLTNGSATVGVTAPIVGDLAQVTADLDLPFRQGSFPVAQPVFGGFNPGSAATFGFAILSDIEAYFLINAAQGDSRTNVLNAPKVTLFNGQQAFVSDASQTPFVISVVPVVGEFAAAQQPVIVVLNEGTMMSIQAVVSEDRRYVRLTVVPFFSQIGDVDTFTFDGSTTTDASSTSSATDVDDDGTNEVANNQQANQVINAGTTVQLPTFQFVSVTTTVSVPDGGTVLLGGIKRLSEGRTEFGVPLLSKLPYINRLFRNVGIGRETDSLMMMVTPRIIIQEEEEERLGLLTP